MVENNTHSQGKRISLDNFDPLRIFDLAPQQISRLYSRLSPDDKSLFLDLLEESGFDQNFTDTLMQSDATETDFIYDDELNEELAFLPDSEITIDDLEAKGDNNLFADFPETQGFLSSLSFLQYDLNHPVLTPEQELQITTKMSNHRERFKQLTKKRNPNRQEKLEIKLAQEGYCQEVDNMVRHNQRLVGKIATKYKGRGEPFEDLMQLGRYGLLRACNKFDPRKGFKFSTYATWWIRQAITRGLADESRLIRFPVHFHDFVNRTMSKIEELRQLFRISDGRDPTLEETAENLGISVRYLQDLLLISQYPVSLDTPLDEDDGDSFTLLDMQTDTTPPIEDQLVEKQRKEVIQSLLGQLPEREALVLAIRYGVEFQGKSFNYPGGDDKTLEETSVYFHVTRERIRQIEEQALRRLRKPRFKKLSEDY